MAKTIPFPEYAPDISTLGAQTSSLISGCVPRADGYGPFKSLVEFSGALPAACRGVFFARRSDATIAIFAGTSNRLYLLDNTTLFWNDVSKGGVPYGDLPPGDNWQFAQFNDLVIAAQISTVPQKFTLSSSTQFANLGGSPPQASHIAIVNRFVMLTGLQASTRRVQWSDLDAPEVWTAGTGLADFQDLPDGGGVHGVAGGDMYGVIFQDESIRTLTYSPGSATTFQITRISTQDTLYGQYSIAEVNGNVFFWSAAGAKMIRPGGVPQPIGKERVDRTFFADVDASNLQLLLGVADPQATRIYWAYKSRAGSAGLVDKMLCYDWSIGEGGRWTSIPIVAEYLASLSRPGYTLEALDAVAPTPLTITGAANNGSGAIRLTLTALFNSNFDLNVLRQARVYGVLGTTEANGQWPFTIIDTTHIDLVGSTFTHAYASGGQIGGALDALPFSLDTISDASLASLAAISSSHKVGFFTGDNIEAVMETSEQDLEGNLVFISSLAPITDASDLVCSIGGRLSVKQTVSYSAETPMEETDGTCSQRVETRYARARARVPAGASWSFVRGVQPDAQVAGDR